MLEALIPRGGGERPGSRELGRRWGEKMSTLVLILWTARAFEIWNWSRRPRSGASERGQLGNFRAVGFHSLSEGPMWGERGRSSALLVHFYEFINYHSFKY